MYRCVSVCEDVHVSAVSMKATLTGVSGVAGRCEPPGVGAGTHSAVFCKSSQTLDY